MKVLLATPREQCVSEMLTYRVVVTYPGRHVWYHSSVFPSHRGSYRGKHVTAAGRELQSF